MNSYQSKPQMVTFSQLSYPLIEIVQQSEKIQNRMSQTYLHPELTENRANSDESRDREHSWHERRRADDRILFHQIQSYHGNWNYPSYARHSHVCLFRREKSLPRRSFERHREQPHAFDEYIERLGCRVNVFHLLGSKSNSQMIIIFFCLFKKL